MGFREIEPEGDVGAESGRAGSSLVGAGAGAASGLETDGAACAAMGGATLPALLLRWRCWLTGITGRCMPGGPYGPGLIERGAGRGPGDMLRGPGCLGPGDMERGPGIPFGPGDMERGPGIPPGPGDIDRGPCIPFGPGDMERGPGDPERGTAGN